MSEYTLPRRTEGTAIPAHERLDSSAPWILWVSTLAALLTTVHHLHGARVYDTPERYHAVWIALSGIAIQAGFLALTRFNRPRLVTIGRQGFVATSVLFFVILFGAFEGGYTHVLAPLLAGGYGPDEPFDAMFEVTGMLQVVAAATVAVLTVRSRRHS